MNIPDANFKDFLIANFDTNGDGEISAAEAAVPTIMDVIALDIADLTGIGAFTGIRRLYCGRNQLSSLPDLSALTVLRQLDCNNNQLTNLPDLSSNEGLARMRFEENQLTSLPGLPQFLGDLRCEFNQLTSLQAIQTLTIFD